MEWNQDIFNANIDFLVTKHCGGKQQAFNDRVGPRDAATSWKKRMPKLEYILKICDEFKCSLDWLITGKEGPFSGAAPEIIELCEKAKEVIESETEFAEALKFNIRAFHKSVDLDRRVTRLEKLNCSDVDTNGGDGG